MYSLLARSSLVLLVLLGGAIVVSAQTVTFFGRVTEQSTGQGVSGAAVVAEGNQTGTRVAVSDAQGNYSLPLGANTNIRLRAYKTNYIFNPFLTTFMSGGGFPISGSFNRDFDGSSFPILILAKAPVLLTEDSSLNALALDGVVQTRDPFPLMTNNYFGTDKRTRLTLLLVDLDLYQGETLSIISVQAQDSQQRNFVLPVENLRKVPGVPWMSQLLVRLPSELAGVTNVTLTVSARGQVSRAAQLRLQ